MKKPLFGNMRWRFGKRATLSVVATLLLVPVGSLIGTSAASASSKAPYKLAFIDGITGPVADISVPNVAGWDTAIDWANSHGGVNGHKIVSTVLDDQYSLSTASVDLQNAISAGNLGIFGGNDSVSWSVLAAKAATDQVPQVTIGVTDNFIDPAQPYIYAATISYRGMGNVQTGFIKNYLIPNKLVPKTPKVAIFDYTSPAITTLNGFFTGDAQKYGWPVVSTQQFSVSATNVSTEAAAIAAAKPDVVLTALLDSDAPLAVSALRQAGYSGPIDDFTAASDYPTFKAIDDPKYYSMVDYMTADQTQIPGIRQMDKEARLTGNATVNDDIDSNFYPTGYVQGLVAIQALKNCGNVCTPTKFNNALNHLGSVNTGGIVQGAALRPGRHRIPQSVIFLHWDPSKNKSVTVGSWIYGGNF